MTISNSRGNDVVQSVTAGFNNYILSEFTGATYTTDPAPPGHYCENPGGMSQATSWGGGLKIGATIAAGSDEPSYSEDSGHYPCLIGYGAATTSYDRNARWRTQSETAATFDGGLTFSFPGVGSVGMSTHQGYSEYTSIDYVYGNRYTTYYTCGVHVLPNAAQTPFNGPNV